MSWKIGWGKHFSFLPMITSLKFIGLHKNKGNIEDARLCELSYFVVCYDHVVHFLLTSITGILKFANLVRNINKYIRNKKKTLKCTMKHYKGLNKTTNWIQPSISQIVFFLRMMTWKRWLTFIAIKIKNSLKNLISIAVPWSHWSSRRKKNHWLLLEHEH